MEMIASIDVTPQQRKIIFDLLKRYLPNTTAWVYGSRAKWTSRPYSDLDMVVFATLAQKVQVSDLREAFEESDLPFTVDLFVWDEIPEQFKKNIEAEKVELIVKKDSSNEWRECRLSEIMNLIGGGTPSRNYPEYWGGSIPWLSVKDFNNNYRHVGDAEEYITKLGLEESSTRILKEGQLIISARGTVGAIAQLSRPMAFNQSCYGIDAKPEYTTNDFLYYLLKYSLSDLRRITHGAVFDTITRETFDYVRVKLPPLEEQHAIANILGSLDDKIEFNRRMNDTLEAMAHTLFKSWFIDFDPVIDNALATGNSIPKELQYRAMQRVNLDNTRRLLSEDIQSLFPNEFQLTQEMGWIPKGWKICSLDQVARYMNGLACQKFPPQRGEKGLPVVKIRELRNGIDEQTDMATALVPEEYIVNNGDILFSWSGSLMVKIWIEGEGVLNQHLFKVMSNQYPRWFIYFWTKHYLNDFIQIAADKATTMGHINRDHLAEAKVSVPDEGILDGINLYIESFFDGSLGFLSQSRYLNELRDMLLPRLLAEEVNLQADIHLGGVSMQGVLTAEEKKSNC